MELVYIAGENKSSFSSPMYYPSAIQWNIPLRSQSLDFVPSWSISWKTLDKLNHSEPVARKIGKDFFSLATFISLDPQGTPRFEELRRIDGRLIGTGYLVLRVLNFAAHSKHFIQRLGIVKTRSLAVWVNFLLSQKLTLVLLARFYHLYSSFVSENGIKNSNR